MFESDAWSREAAIRADVGVALICFHHLTTMLVSRLVAGCMAEAREVEDSPFSSAAFPFFLGTDFVFFTGVSTTSSEPGWALRLGIVQLNLRVLSTLR
jgi:hypothetical protein